jgi:hypothetical protein
MRWYNCFDLKIHKYAFFWAGKPMVISQFRNFLFLTLFVTSLTPNFTRNRLKFV